MKLIIVACILAVAAAAPPPRISYSNDNVSLLRYDSDIEPDGRYSFGFEQTDGQKRQEEGQLKNAGLENESIVVKGSYSWVGPDGVEYIVLYIADENGFQPEIQQGPGGAVPAQVASLLG